MNVVLLLVTFEMLSCGVAPNETPTIGVLVYGMHGVCCPPTYTSYEVTWYEVCKPYIIILHI